MPPHLKCKEGDDVLVRAKLLTACDGFFQVKFERGNFSASQWVPSEDVAKREDIDDLPPAPRQITPYYFG